MDMLFKKLISALLLPIPLSLSLGLVGLFLLTATRFKRWGIGLISTAWIILFLFSTNFLPTYLLKSLESQFNPLVKIPVNVSYIVVLGGGNGGSRQYPANLKLSSASLARLIQGLLLFEQTDHSTLILSGGSVFGSARDSDLMENLAIQLGINPNSVKIERGSEDTREEADYLYKIVGTKPFILVTSAYHMPRAMALFKKHGMNPIAAPTQFLLNENVYSMKYYFPNSLNITHSDIVIHEYLGLWWAKLHNWI